MPTIENSCETRSSKGKADTSPVTDHVVRAGAPDHRDCVGDRVSLADEVEHRFGSSARQIPYGSYVAAAREPDVVGAEIVRELERRLG